MSYVIINSETIKKRIEELNKPIAHYDGIYVSECQKAQIEIIEEVLSKSIPLIPEIEKAFEASREFNSLDGVVDVDVVVGYYPETRDLQGVFINSEEYIEQLKLSI